MQSFLLHHHAQHQEGSRTQPEKPKATFSMIKTEFSDRLGSRPARAEIMRRCARYSVTTSAVSFRACMSLV